MVFPVGIRSQRVPRPGPDQPAWRHQQADAARVQRRQLRFHTTWHRAWRTGARDEWWRRHALLQSHGLHHQWWRHRVAVVRTCLVFIRMMFSANFGGITQGCIFIMLSFIVTSVYVYFWSSEIIICLILKLIIGYRSYRSQWSAILNVRLLIPLLAASCFWACHPLSVLTGRTSSRSKTTFAARWPACPIPTLTSGCVLVAPAIPTSFIGTCCAPADACACSADVRTYSTDIRTCSANARPSTW